MATALVKLYNIHSFTNVVEGGDALILLHQAACGERAKCQSDSNSYTVNMPVGQLSTHKGLIYSHGACPFVINLPEKCSATHIRSSFTRAVSFIHVPNVEFIFATFLGLIRDWMRHSEEKPKNKLRCSHLCHAAQIHHAGTENAPFLFTGFPCSLPASFTNEVSSFGIECDRPEGQ